MEKLLEKQFGPLDSDVKGASLRGDVGRVDTELEQLLLGVKLSLVRSVVDQVLAALATRHILLLHDGLHFGKVARVSGHISRQDDPYEPLSEGLEVVPREVFQEVVLLTVENRKCLSCMIILLD